MRILLFLCTFMCTVSASAQVTYFSIEKMDYDHRTFSEGAKITTHNIEETILANPSAQVVDRETFQKIEDERERQKSESFIDGTYVEQGKASGAHYSIFTKYNTDERTLEVRIMDVASSTVAFKEEYKLSHFVEKSGMVKRPNYYSRYINEITSEFMKNFMTEVMTIKVVSIDVVDKGKAKEALMYCPNNCKLKAKSSIELFHKEKIPNTDLHRYNKIGEAKVKSDEANGLYLIAVKKGGKEVYKLNAEKQEIYGRLKI